MRELEIAFYAEGSTDHLFLPPVIQRTIELVIGEKGYKNIEAPQGIRSIIIGKLERLNHVSSYKQFVDDLTEALRNLQLIS
jgi:hypothetical protein